MAIKIAASVRSTKEKEKVKLQFRYYRTSILQRQNETILKNANTEKKIDL